jgi:hypothetical protein
VRAVFRGFMTAKCALWESVCITTGVGWGIFVDIVESCFVDLFILRIFVLEIAFAEFHISCMDDPSRLVHTDEIYRAMCTFVAVKSTYLVLHKIKELYDLVIDLVFADCKEDPIVLGITVQDVDSPAMAFQR